MTKNRTGVDIFAALGTELMVLLLVVLAAGLGISRYIAAASERMRRVEMKLRRRAARRIAA
jgi:hypothetical protein